MPQQTTTAFQMPPWFEVRFVDQPGGCERPHTHDSLIVSAVSGGEIAFQINEEQTCLREGMVAAVGPNMLHCVRCYSGDFKGIYVLEIFGIPPSWEGYSEIHFQLFKSRLLRGGRHYDDFVSLCRQLLSPLEESQKFQRYSEWAGALFDARYGCDAVDSSGERELAARIRRLLDAHEGAAPPFDEISRACGLGKERCNRIFRNAYNISIQGYFLNEKAARARLLLASSRSLAQIALECGFYDQSHFSRIFKEIFQVSPARYRALIGAGCQSHTRNRG